MALTCRSGTPSVVASCSTISGLGTDRPVSRKLTWRADTSAVEGQVELAQAALAAPVLEQGGEQPRPVVGIGHRARR